MAKKKKKGVFAYMDFIIVGGIAAAAYFLFSSFSKGPIKEESTTGGALTPPNPNSPTPPTPPSGGTGTQNVTGDVIYFSDTERKKPLFLNDTSVNSVKALQIFLTKAGWDTKGVDGIFGNDTETALRGYLNLGWTVLPVTVSLERLGIDAAKFSTKQVFGYDPKSLLTTMMYKEYVGSVSGWQTTSDSVKAYTKTL